MSISVSVVTSGRFNFGPKGERETLEPKSEVKMTYDSTAGVVGSPVFGVEVKRGDRETVDTIFLTQLEFDAFQYAFSKVFAR